MEPPIYLKEKDVSNQDVIPKVDLQQPRPALQSDGRKIQKAGHETMADDGAGAWCDDENSMRSKRML